LPLISAFRLASFSTRPPGVGPPARLLRRKTAFTRATTSRGLNGVQT
jgi:hypothetical protein